MNRTKIEWTTFTWNPITGCDHGCWYCYAMRMAKRFPKRFPTGFKPTFWTERLKEPWEYKKPSKIFACSISDLFAPWTLPLWRQLVLSSIYKCPVKHTFQLLTKNPELIPPKTYPENVWIGTTVTCENEDWRNIEAIKKVKAGVRFVSFEPLLGALPRNLSLKGIDWIIIGKLTGSNRVKLQFNWIWRIAEEATELGIPIFFKNNLQKQFPQFKLQEWPR